MSSIKKIPVFVFPSALNFYLPDKVNHKQLLTLYNPYDFPLRFKVLSTAPNKYVVIDPEGSIAPRTCVDIVVRHKLPNLANCNITDKFRITLLDYTTKQILGKRDVDATLLEFEKDNSGDADHFHSLQTDRDSSISESRSRSIRGNLRQPFSTIVIACIAFLVCVIGLMLPTAQETYPETNIPPSFHISSKVKLVFAFALGLSVMIMLR